MCAQQKIRLNFPSTQYSLAMMTPQTDEQDNPHAFWRQLNITLAGVTQALNQIPTGCS
jgi:hypothetical protein